MVRSLLNEQLVLFLQGPLSKKKVFENIASAFANFLSADAEILDELEDEVVDALLARERLGSTALGSGVALPHGRVEDINSPALCIVKVQHEAIDYDEHEQNVWLVFALIVPTDENEQHLKIYAALSRCLQDEDFYASLQQAVDKQALLSLFQ